MLTIPIALFGDYWINGQEVENQIRDADITEIVHLDFQAEGVSVTASGLVQRLLDICEETGRSTSSIKLINNPNFVEQTPFENVNVTNHAMVTSLSHQVFRSHFLSGNLLRDYWRDPLKIQPHAVPFGLFIGRRTVAREMILYQCLEQPQRFLFSMMQSPVGMLSHDREEIPQWIHSSDIADFQKWRRSVDIPSLDGKKITDQYRRFVPNPDTNNSILNFYDRFLIEIVPETYTRGHTFFPTEKTVRPIMAEKPILVYGPRYFLRRLRDLYGFRTYGDIWDESYDQLEGPARWRAMWKTMQDLNISTLPAEACEIAQYNRNVLEEMKEWRR